MNEFDVIRRWFRRLGSERADVVVGVGDDAAVVTVGAGGQIVITTDTLVAGRHFLDTDPAFDVGHKTLAVNLSDVAAMGAEPAWATVSAALPAIDEAWIDGFCAGLDRLARRHAVAVVGGDTVRGPVMTLTVQLIGLLPAGGALLRSGARAGDAVLVTGTLGDAAMGLSVVRGELAVEAGDAEAVIARLRRPEPRVDAGPRLRGLAHACIDVSDGLCADLSHVLAASAVGAEIDLAAVPLSDAYRRCLGRIGMEPALTGGDDYELLFTAAPGAVGRIVSELAALGVPCSPIGRITPEPGLRVRDRDGRVRTVGAGGGFDHFAA